MSCKFAVTLLTKEYGSINVCVDRTDLHCNGEPVDKAECPLWSGGLKLQTYTRPIA